MSSRTASPRTPCSARVSAGICWARSELQKLATLVWPRCSSARAAVSKSAHRSRRGPGAPAAAPGRRGRRPRRSRRGQSVPDHSSQSTSSAVRAVVEQAPRPAQPAQRERPRAALAPRPRVGAVADSPASAARAGPSSSRRSRTGRSARARAASRRRRPPLLPGRRAAGQRRAPRSRRGRPAGRQQRLGPVRAEVVGRASGSSREVRPRPAARRAAAAPPARATSGVSSLATSTGTPAAPSARRSARDGARARSGPAPPSRDQGTPVLEVGPAQQVGDVLGLGPLGVEGEHLDPSGAVRRRPRSGCRNAANGLGVDRAGGGQPRGHAPGRPQQPGPEPAGDPQRHRAGRAAVGAGGTSAGSRGCRGPRPRGRRRSTGRGSPTTVRSRPSPASARSSRTWLGSVSWYSSTKTCRNRARQLGPRAARPAAPRGRSARGSRSRSGRRGSSRYCCMNRPAATSSGASCASPSRLRSTGSSPFSRARASTACTSRAKPRVRDAPVAARTATAGRPGCRRAARWRTTSCSGADSSRSGAAYRSAEE